MHQEWLTKTLSKIGLQTTDIQVYIFLTRNSTQSVSQIVKSLDIDRKAVNGSLKALRSKGCVKIAADRGRLYEAEPIEKVLENIADIKNREAQSIEQNKQTILRDWQLKLKRA